MGGLVALFVAYVLVEFSGSQQSEKEVSGNTSTTAANPKQTIAPTRTRGGSLGRANEQEVHIEEVRLVIVLHHGCPMFCP